MVYRLNWDIAGGWSGFRILAESRDISLLVNFQNISVAHRNSYQKYCFFFQSKAVIGLNWTLTFFLEPRSKMCVAIPRLVLFAFVVLTGTNWPSPLYGTFTVRFVYISHSFWLSFFVFWTKRTNDTRAINLFAEEEFSRLRSDICCGR